MKTVKVSYKQSWSKAGTHFQGRFIVTKDLYLRFKEYVTNYLKRFENARILTSDELNEKVYLKNMETEWDDWNNKDCLFMTITQRRYFVKFMKDSGILFDEKRATGKMNYYLEIK